MVDVHEAGLSLFPALDGCAPMELMAYAEEQAPGLVDVLFQLALRESPAVAYAVGDLASFDAAPSDLGIPLGRHFRLVSPREEEALLRAADSLRSPATLEAAAQSHAWELH
jgi:hypothetical protein